LHTHAGLPPFLPQKASIAVRGPRLSRVLRLRLRIPPLRFGTPAPPPPLTGTPHGMLYKVQAGREEKLKFLVFRLNKKHKKEEKL